MKIIGSLNYFYRYAFPTQAVLITCNNKHGDTNIITVAWHTTISKEPPFYGISLAPERYSHGLIENTKEFVVNFAPFNLLEKVQFCGTHSGRNTKKIENTNLTLIPAQKVQTPLIKDCYAHLECIIVKMLPCFLEAVHLLHNYHLLFVAPIQ